MPKKTNIEAKDVQRLALFSIWFSFALWLAFWLMLPIGWLDAKLIPTKTREIVIQAIFLVSWARCVCSLSWIPIWWARRRHWEIVRSNGRNITFLLLLMGCIIYCTTAWDKYIADKVYICTDSVPWVFVHPGDWVHGNYVAVPQIVLPRSMSEPDAIKEGWSVPQLWCLWWSWVAASIGVSAILAFLVWWPRTRRSLSRQMPTVICADSAKS
jgi:hypothetical protein